MHIENTIRVPTLLHLTHKVVHLLSINQGDKLTPKAPIAMFPTKTALIFAYQTSCFLRHLTEKLSVFRLFYVKNRAQV